MNIPILLLVPVLISAVSVVIAAFMYVRAKALQQQIQRQTQLQHDYQISQGRLTELQRRLHEMQQERLQLQTKHEQQQQLLLQYREQLGKSQEWAQQVSQLQQREQAREQYLQQLQQQLAKEQSRSAALIAASEKDQQQMQEKQQLLENNSEQLKQQFALLANEIFDAKQQQFSHISQQNISTLLKPLQQQVESFRVRMEEVHVHSVSGNSKLVAELDRLKALNQQVSAEAINLTRALKGDKKLQGNWGEQKVELLLETCGLRAGIEYEREKSFRDDQGANKRPDFIIRLPEGKQLIIDSKVSLVHYAQAVASDDPATINAMLDAHVQSIRQHIASLSAKNYTELLGQKTPDFVLLFVAVEPAYFCAAERYPALFQEAFDKGITLVTASTLMPLLQVVANVWAMHNQNQNTRILAEQAVKVYDKLRVFVEKINKLGFQLQTAQKTYDDAFDTLSRGQGSLSRTVDRFVELGVKVNKRLPDNVLDGLED